MRTQDERHALGPNALILRQYYFSNIDYLYLYLSLMINKILNIDIEMFTPFVHLDFSWVQFGIENDSIAHLSLPLSNG